MTLRVCFMRISASVGSLSLRALIVSAMVSVMFGSVSGLAVATAAGDCPTSPPKFPEMARSAVYSNVPFKAGEAATYELTWSGIKAGYATIEVRSPRRHNGIWQRVFHIDAATGDWFKAIFVARETMEAVSRPWDFGVTQFYMEQNEGKLFGRSFQQKKWLSFDHDRCHVDERIQVPDKPEDNVGHDLAYGANDALGVVFNLRTRNFHIGTKERALVYTSEKNWFLEAEPVALEQVTVPAGTFKTVKIKLQTFIGKDLQQKGDVWAWISTDTPQRQLVQVQGEIKIGSVWIKLSSYTPGA